jgi:hypothetical protein
LTWESGTAVNINTTNDATYFLPDGRGSSIIAVVTAASLPQSNVSDSGVTVATALATAGFGVGNRDTARGSAIFHDHIYLGFENDDSDMAELWRSKDGLLWVKAAQDSFGKGTEDDHNDSLIVFNDYLYVGTSAGYIYRTQDSYLWEEAIKFPVNHWNVCRLAIFNNLLYAAVFRSGETTPGGGFEIYRTADGLNWAPVYNNNEPQLSYLRGFNAHHNRLFVAAGSARGGLGPGAGEVWYTEDGLNWSQSGPEGLGNSNNTDLPGLVTFNDYLYVTTLNSVDGSKIYRTLNGDSWEKVADLDSSNTNTDGAWFLITYSNGLYAGTLNDTDGGAMWRTENGRDWTKVSANGFGTGKEQRLLTGFVFKGYLYVNAANDVSNTGWELWRTQFEPTEPSTFHLVPVWSRITWLTQLPTTFTSYSALDHIESGCPRSQDPPQAIAQRKNGWWESAVHNYGGVVFPLVADHDYYIKVASACDWSHSH